ncbi:TIGR03619 family F420-dependent LLM class oxidoreductase [Planotetraspora kaengkrachanensis]|uniref:LLM class F420-dependent oxidoreductase n=1 Tax=Planotetraspora kaengkrachanensis TaxID=575193 RepID=A0A8J3Q189_9ACTN|nr:TIGR03619 family F420-dependent LLM class oxidoreductase [Planotetraspora kaengkrachanensis]GIG84755.1 LLM class F420-dependent oxidoreductase [Planotetraspora kaengkrachanensis]
MKIGFAVPHLHKQAHDIARTAYFAREAEKAGADSLWVGDRNFAAVNPKIGAGGQGNTIPVEYNTAADPFVVLGVAASATERVKLGTHVLIAPVYPPVQLARMLTSIDLISGGRLIPGFGIGWSPEEYEAVGYEFSTRGARMNELLDALEVLWTQDPAEFHGKLIDLPLQHSPLKPAQRPRPPIYLGGTAEAALRRVGERADGWLPLCMVPYFVNIDMMREQRGVVDRFARDAGRDPASIDTIMRVNIMQGVSAQQTADVIKTVAEATGIDHFLVDSSFVASNVDESLDLVGEVLPLIRRG